MRGFKKGSKRDQLGRSNPCELKLWQFKVHSIPFPHNQIGEILKLSLNPSTDPSEVTCVPPWSLRVPTCLLHSALNYPLSWSLWISQISLISSASPAEAHHEGSLHFAQDHAVSRWCAVLWRDVPSQHVHCSQMRKQNEWRFAKRRTKRCRKMCFTK